MAADLGIDLGTATTKIYTKKQGVAVNEPSLVVQNNDGKIVALGNEASEMTGRTPDGVTAIRPIRNGVITNFNSTVALLKHFIKKTSKNSFMRVRAVVCIPSGTTEVEKRAASEAAMSAGAKEVLLMDEPLAAAIGAGVPVTEPKGSMVLDIGAGTTEAAVISLGGIVVYNSIRVGGDAFDSAIIQQIKKKHNIMIGESTAEAIKIQIGSAYPHRDEGAMEIKGRDAISGLPKVATVRSAEVRDAITECLAEIVDAVKATLEKTPPELASDVMENGIVLTGGGAMLKGLGRLINANTEIPVFIAENPVECTAIGAGKALESPDNLKKYMLASGVRRDKLH